MVSIGGGRGGGVHSDGGVHAVFLERLSFERERGREKKTASGQCCLDRRCWYYTTLS